MFESRANTNRWHLVSLIDESAAFIVCILGAKFSFIFS